MNESEDISVMAVKANDPELLKAKDEALSAIDFFLSAYQEHKDNIGVFFAIKFAVPDDGSKLFLWYSFQGENGGQLLGSHYQIPDNLTDFENIKVAKNEIEDWMINDHGHLIGGWSVRVQRSRLPESERAQFDDDAGVKYYEENNF